MAAVEFVRLTDCRRKTRLSVRESAAAGHASFGERGHAIVTGDGGGEHGKGDGGAGGLPQSHAQPGHGLQIELIQ